MYNIMIDICIYYEMTPISLINIHYHTVGFPSGSVVNDLPASIGDTEDAGSIPGLGRSSGGENSNPLYYSCLKNPMQRGAWLATVHVVAICWTKLSS